ADQAINRILRDRAFGAAGAELLVEEYMPGEELSVLAFTDGEHVLPMLPAQDHKRLLNGDRGPNTGGMGAYAPVALGDGALLEEVTERILLPTLAALRACACQFSGVLYAGLMLTPDGPRVVEFNCRFGDPEIEALLPLLDSALLEPVLAIAQGESIEGMTFSWRDACAVTTVVAADGYPGRSRQGTPVTLPPPPDGTIVFHAGTKQSENGSLVSAGGRVLAITALADSVDAAQRASVAYAEEVQLEGKQYRTDIGWREMHRSAGTPRN
ncbi:MAG TPA: phosphoribosylglycinamide synthetase C domain-containing protein, partial [Gemmatimonadaceae bacterium]|nr:phosphoribosylglycinamide synthetase C domain-containing protein [Gemmatimonadaceae bacterium]